MFCYANIGVRIAFPCKLLQGLQLKGKYGVIKQKLFKQTLKLTAFMIFSL